MMRAICQTRGFLLLAVMAHRSSASLKQIFFQCRDLFRGRPISHAMPR
jgi:hypothetical protein